MIFFKKSWVFCVHFQMIYEEKNNQLFLQWVNYIYIKNRTEYNIEFC